MLAAEDARQAIDWCNRRLQHLAPNGGEARQVRRMRAGYEADLLRRAHVAEARYRLASQTITTIGRTLAPPGWLVTCMEHETTAPAATLAEARALATRPSWCPPCVPAVTRYDLAKAERTLRRERRRSARLRKDGVCAQLLDPAIDRARSQVEALTSALEENA